MRSGGGERRSLISVAWPRYFIDDIGGGANLSTWDACRLIVTHTTGNDSHYIDGSGVRHWISNTTIFACLNRSYPRYWTSSRSLIDSGWPEGSWASC
jgi:hypothetical protein